MTEKAPKDAAMITAATVKEKLGDVQVMVSDLGSKARYWKAMAESKQGKIDELKNDAKSVYDRTWKMLATVREGRIRELQAREIDLMAANKHLDTRLGLKTKRTEEQECRIEDQLSAINVLDRKLERQKASMIEQGVRLQQTIGWQTTKIAELMREPHGLETIEEEAYQFALQGHHGTYIGYDGDAQSVKMCARCRMPWDDGCGCQCHDQGWSKAQYFEDQGSWVQVRGDEIWCAPCYNDGSCDHENWVEAQEVGEPEDSALIEVGVQIANAEGLSIRYLHKLPSRS